MTQPKEKLLFILSQFGIKQTQLGTGPKLVSAFHWSCTQVTKNISFCWARGEPVRCFIMTLLMRPLSFRHTHTTVCLFFSSEKQWGWGTVWLVVVPIEMAPHSAGQEPLSSDIPFGKKSAKGLATLIKWYGFRILMTQTSPWGYKFLSYKNYPVGQ